MSDEKLFSMMRESLVDFRPEVPQGVYSGMRRKLWWSNFFRFNASSLNAWYVGAALVSTSVLGLWGWSKGSEALKVETTHWHQGVQVAASDLTVPSSTSCSASCSTNQTSACTIQAQTKSSAKTIAEAGCDVATHPQDAAAATPSVNIENQRISGEGNVESTEVITDATTPTESKDIIAVPNSEVEVKKKRKLKVSHYTPSEDK